MPTDIPIKTICAHNVRDPSPAHVRAPGPAYVMFIEQPSAGLCGSSRISRDMASLRGRGMLFRLSVGIGQPLAFWTS